MSAKNRDNKNRWRNITVGFRVSPEENELINKAVLYRACRNRSTVTAAVWVKMWWYRAIQECIRLSKQNLPLFLQSYEELKRETA